jgi:hypothetical protein
LKCWQRNKDQVAAGCIGGEDDHSRGDYCYNPTFVGT